MRYMIFDNEGNAVDTFRTRVAAEASLRAIVNEEPDSVEELVLVAYDDKGRTAGATKATDLPPPVRMESRWIVYEATASCALGRKRRIRDVNRYIPILPAGRLVRDADPVD